MATQTRRAYDRIDIEVDITIHHADREIKARCLNISQGGMFIDAELIPIGENIKVEFKLPDLAQTIMADARVCWYGRDSQQGLGVQFDGLRAIEVWAINQLFRRRSKGEL